MIPGVTESNKVVTHITDLCNLQLLRLRGRDGTAATVDPKGPSDPLSPSQYEQTRRRMVTRTPPSLNCPVNPLNAGSRLSIRGKDRGRDMQEEGKAVEKSWCSNFAVGKGEKLILIQTFCHPAVFRSLLP